MGKSGMFVHDSQLHFDRLHIWSVPDRKVWMVLSTTDVHLMCKSWDRGRDLRIAKCHALSAIRPVPVPSVMQRTNVGVKCISTARTPDPQAMGTASDSRGARLHSQHPTSFQRIRNSLRGTGFGQKFQLKIRAYIGAARKVQRAVAGFLQSKSLRTQVCSGGSVELLLNAAPECYSATCDCQRRADHLSSPQHLFTNE